jgi:hypothetical protein
MVVGWQARRQQAAGSSHRTNRFRDVEPLHPLNASMFQLLIDEAADCSNGVGFPEGQQRTVPFIHCSWWRFEEHAHDCLTRANSK